SQVAAQIPNTSLPQQLPSGESTVQQPSTSQIQTSSLSLDDQIKLQQKQVEIAELNLKNIKQNMYKQQKYVIAEFDGTVTIVNAKDNSYFTSSQFPAIAVEDLNNLQIALDVNPYDAVNLKEGQKAYILFADKTFEGVVSKVSPTATKVITQTGGDNVVKVYVDLLNNDGTIKPGFNVDVDIKIGEKKDTIKVPSEAIVSDKNGNEFVYVVENGIAKQKKVKTGLASDLETEIISGVNVGEKVILNPTSSIEDGTKVSVKGGKD
ncbi:MAG TPA: efflux RND transporter periplasmic adaptor subunit, partial [Thermoanaerobacter sp.]|nr:efflux RND transporter periplasmic adaptor subunit [Thermoanaerobacter sp.]